MLDSAEPGGDPGLAGGDGLAVAPAVGTFREALAELLDLADVGLALVGVRSGGEHDHVGGSGIQDQADRLVLEIPAGQRDDPGAVGLWPGLLWLSEAVPGPFVELGQHKVGPVDLVAGGAEVLADRAEGGAPAGAVVHEPVGLRPPYIGFLSAVQRTTAAIHYDQQLWNELVSLRFAEAAHGALILGPVGVGKTHLATALGHIAVRRRLTVHMARADHLFKRLKAARLDNSTEAEHRRLAAVNLLIIDDFALHRLDETATTDFYELTVARHRTNATVVTSNRTPVEWLGLMHDQLLAQSAVDRLTSTCHELVIEGDSYRKRQRPSLGSPRSTDTPA